MRRRNVAEAAAERVVAFGVLCVMNNENEIHLSGPFEVFDSSGRAWQVNAIRIFNESYAIVDVYVDLATSMEDEPLHEDPVVIRQLLARLRLLGYVGPDFGSGDIGLQDDKLIVLEAGEEFGIFAESKGWRNLAESYVDDEELNEAQSHIVFSELMRKLQAK